MKELTKEQMNEVNGGFNISGTILNGLIRGISTMFDLGKSLGSSIVRFRRRSFCPIP